jgi:hypothetical protein
MPPSHLLVILVADLFTPLVLAVRVIRHLDR